MTEQKTVNQEFNNYSANDKVPCGWDESPHQTNICSVCILSS